MLTRGDILALLKVLMAAAWADSRLSQAEINYTKELARKFRLDEAEWLQLQPYFEDPPNEKEVEGLFRDLLSRIATPAARNEVIRHLEEILKADSVMTAEEHDFLDQYKMILKNASTVESIVGRMRNLFRKPQQQVHVLDLDEFIRNKVLFKLRRRLGTEQITPQMYRLCLLGSLMGIVANADDEVDQRELEEIRRQLQFRGNFDPEALELLLSIIEEESVRGLDRARLVNEYAGDASFDERVQLLDLLFGMAAANGNLTHAELEELRGISSAMHLSHRQYIDAKLRARR